MTTDLTERGPERFNCKAQASKLSVKSVVQICR